MLEHKLKEFTKKKWSSAVTIPSISRSRGGTSSLIEKSIAVPGMSIRSSSLELLWKLLKLPCWKPLLSMAPVQKEKQKDDNKVLPTPHHFFFFLPIYHLNDFKTSNSVALSTHVMLSNHHHYPFPELIIPNRNSPSRKQCIPILQSLVKSIVLSVSTDLLPLNISYK